MGQISMQIKTPDGSIFSANQHFIELKQSWFIPRGIDAGETIVFSGAQMLLSGAYRWQITDEHD